MHFCEKDALDNAKEFRERFPIHAGEALQPFVDALNKITGVVVVKADEGKQNADMKANDPYLGSACWNVEILISPDGPGDILVKWIEAYLGNLSVDDWRFSRPRLVMGHFIYKDTPWMAQNQGKLRKVWSITGERRFTDAGVEVIDRLWTELAKVAAFYQPGERLYAD